MMSTFEENWDAMAKAYEAFTEDENSYSYQIEWPCIQTLLPDLKNTSHYLPDLNRVFRSIHRLLKNEGTCIVSVMHPVYTAQYPIDRNGVFPEDKDWNVRYLDKSLRAYVQPWIEYNEGIDNYLSTSYHHTVSDYINAIIQAGLTVQRVEEPAPPKEWEEKFPGRYEAYIETPSFMIFKLKK